MSYKVEFLQEAQKDLEQLDHSVRVQVAKGIIRVSENPVSVYKGGYGKPLGNKGGSDLTKLFKIKFRNIGIRVVYTLKEKDGIMIIVVVSVRDDGKVYKEAEKRRDKYKL